MTRIAALAAVLVLALLAAALAWPDGDAMPVPTPTAAATATAIDPAATPASALEDRAAEPVVLPDRTAATGLAGTPAATLYVEAWRAAAPATELALQLVPRDRADAAAVRHATTDAAGRATFRALDAGDWRLCTVGGDALDLTVREHDVTVELRLQPGIDVVGTVVDPHGAPVAGAAVWLQTRDRGWTGGSIVTHSDAAGRFALAAVPATVSLGAFAHDRGPGALVDLELLDARTRPVAVTLQVAATGGQLQGRIVRADGRPIAGALVGIGRDPPLPPFADHRVVETWSMRTARTDADGRYDVVGLPVGTHAVTVRADGCGLHRAECTVAAAATTTLDLALAAGGTIRGTVTDRSGAPQPGALVHGSDVPPLGPLSGNRVYDTGAPFGHRTAVADGSGRYVLADVTAGAAFVFAQPRGAPGSRAPAPSAAARCNVPAGGTIEWHAVLDEGRTITGVLRTRDGHPVPDALLSATDERSGERHLRSTDARGAFRFQQLGDSTYTVRVAYWTAPPGTPVPERTAVAPDQAPLELVAPYEQATRAAKGTVSGRIDDAGRRVRDPAALRVTWTRDELTVLQVPCRNGAEFRFPSVAPGSFRLALTEAGKVLASSDWLELAPGAALDAGVLRTEPGGSVAITLVREPATATLHTTLLLCRDGDPFGSRIDAGTATSLRVDDLTPGAFTLRVEGLGLSHDAARGTVVAGSTATATVRVRAGRPVRLQAWFPDGAAPQRYEYTLRSLEEAAPEQREAGAFAGAALRPFVVATRLPFGRWRFELTVDGTLAHAAEFAVDGIADGMPVAVRAEPVVH
ncbi:MAG: carboxypeptidase regulatory-like domain-containing protein [Planctomycetes bacterium]|nr:carboxypeptidase regulatory-like domain-containing protein [Planctomycetota bacterium]